MDENYSYRPEKKKSGSGKIIALALVFSLIGAIIGSAITNLYLNENKNIINNNAENTKALTISTKDDVNVATAVAQKAMPSVVGITTKGVQQTLFGNVEVSGTGSGIVIDERGYILTNAHVVNMNGQFVKNPTVQFNNETTTEGTTIWADANMDVAIIKVNPKGKLNVAELGNSDELQIGEKAIAIGNPISLQFSKSVTEGIISGLNRYVGQVSGGGYMTGLIQTDASINGGNSGGPLLNAKGQVIGINTVKVQSAEGLGFSIPINNVKPVIKQVIETGTYRELSLGVLSMDMKMANQTFGKDFGTKDGIFLFKVYEGGPAATAGLQNGDIITKINGDKIESLSSLKTILYKYEVGDSVDISYLRNGKEATTELKFTDYSVDNDVNAKRDIENQRRRAEDRQGVEERQDRNRGQNTDDIFRAFQDFFGN